MSGASRSDGAAAPRGLAAGFLRPLGAARAASAQGGGVGEVGQAGASAAGDPGGDGGGLQEEDRAQQAQGDEDQAANHRIGALDRAPLISHQRQHELEDGDDEVGTL